MQRFNPELRSHWFSYIVLIAGLAGMAMLFLMAWPDRFWLRITALGLVFFYFVWGWRTHAQHGHVPGSVLAEYGGIGLLGLSLLWLVTL